jgi:hypothetical protein
MAIAATEPMIHLVFPRFERAGPVTMALAISCIPLSVVASIIPIVISLSQRPWAHAIRLFAPAFVILLGAMVAGNRMGGIAGQAWACTAAGLALIISVATLMRRLGILEGWAAVRIIFFQAVAIVGLSWLAVAVAPAVAEPVPPPGWKLTFTDNFKSLQLWDGPGHGIWEPHYPWGDRANGDNNELVYYVDPRAGHDQPAVAGIAPITVSETGVVIRARPIYSLKLYLAHFGC